MQPSAYASARPSTPALDLLRRDIGRCPDGGFLLRAPRIGETPGQPEIGQVDVLVLVEEHVRGLDVAVDKPAGVRGVEGGGNLCADRDRASGSSTRSVCNSCLSSVPST